LVLENALSLTGATLKTNSTTFTTNANALTLSGGILEVEGVQNLGGVVPDNSTTLRLAANSTIDDNASLSVGTLDLANFALTLDDQMAGLSIAQPVTLDASGEQIVTGAADLSLNGGISVTSGTLSSTGGTLGLPGGATLASGALFSTSNTTLNLGGSLAVAGTWSGSNTTSISLTTDNASLSSTVALSLASLQTNGHDFELASATTDLTIENAFALSGSETLSTQGADLIFESSADISPGSTLDASGGGQLEFQQGGTDNGTINARNATFKIGAAYAVPGTLKTNGSTTWTLGTVNLDLSGGTLELGGTVVLDKVLTDNLTTFKLGEDATVTRNQGFTLGGLDLDNSTLTLGSATTDLTLDLGDSSDNGSDSSDNIIDITDNLPGSAFTAVGNVTSGSETVGNAFDGSTSTKYLNTGAGSGVIINAGTAYIVDTLGLTTANDVDNRDPTSFTLYGSDDGSSWTSVVANESLSPPTSRYSDYDDVSFSNSTAYQYYKLIFETVRGGTGIVLDFRNSSGECTGCRNT